jgi:hypothetical protein
VTPNEVLTAWVEALESDQYEQGTYVLHEGDEYCCLGVLCELGRIHGIVQRVEMKENRNGFPALYRYDGEEIFLPVSVAQWVGLLNSDELWTLVNMNDSGEYTFPEIAQYIRKNLIREDI